MGKVAGAGVHAVLLDPQGAPGHCPGREDVKEGIIAYRIAVHATDIARIRAGIHDSRGRAFLGCYRIDLEEAVRALART